MSNDKKLILNCPLCSKKELHVTMSDKGLQQCISCGYSTNEDLGLGKGSKEDNESFQELDDFMKKYHKLESNYLWIPSVMQLPIGIYYPSEKDNKLIWVFAPLIEIPKDEVKNYPKPEGGFYDKRYNMEGQLEFNEFGEGLVEINMVMGIIKKNEEIEDATKNKKDKSSTIDTK